MAVLLIMFLGLATCMANAVHAQSAAGAWSSKFPTPPGANGIVYTMTTYGSNLVVGGEFTKIAGVQARGLAKFDGQYWSEFGGGVQFTNSSIRVFSTVSDGTNLYIGGDFTSAGGVPATNIAKWSGDHWQSLEGGLTGRSMLHPIPSVSALHLQGTNLFAGGAFHQAGATQAWNVARWDGLRWHALGEGVFLPNDGSEPTGLRDGRVYAIAGDGTNIFAGGRFTYAGNIRSTNLAMWNGSEWRTIGAPSDGTATFIWAGEPISGFIQKLEWHDDSLYAVGDFKRMAGLAITNFARWQNGAWDMPIAINGWLSSIVKLGQDLYVAGDFESATTNSTSFAATNVLNLHAGIWTPMHTRLIKGEGIYTMRNYGGSFLAGGDFGNIENISAGNIARQTRAGWRSLTTGVGNALHGAAGSIASDGTNVYLYGNLYGSFSSVASMPALYSVAHWNGSNWRTLPRPGTNVYFSHLAVLNTTLYAAGSFDIPEIAATDIAAWDGERWKAVGDHGSHLLFDARLLPVQSNLFGSFTNGTKWWDGAESHTVPWTTVMNYFGERLATDGTNVYIAQESFVDSRVHVARWDGTNVFEYPPANLQRIAAIGAAGTNVWLTGWPNGSPPVVLFRFDGADWTKVSEFPEDEFITDLLGVGDNLIATGLFKSIAGVAANSIAQWDGSQWRALDRGVKLHDQRGIVWNVAAAKRRLYFAGEFDEAGPNPSGNIAIWHMATDVKLSIQANALNTIQLSGGAGDHIQIEGAESVDSWMRLTDITLLATTTMLSDPRPQISTTNRFYRAKILEP